MAYYIDLKSITLDEYKTKLTEGTLIPSRQVIREKIDACFDCLKNHDILNVEILKTALNNKKKFEDLSNQKPLTEEYLTQLKREVNSLHPKPNKISEFVGISEETVSALQTIGIKDTKQLFERIITKDARQKLGKETGIDAEIILELTCLTDLSRIKWVGNMFARVLYETGYRTVKEVTLADPEKLYAQIKQFNEENKLYKGQIGINDMKTLVEVAKDVTGEIKY
ncbi:MAG: DUF4332 domain-containing protein [Bacteroidales bacterium]|nr:DUF4332 domain-containing protein [Bacteroidales bacterium]MBN2820451.1 DUF4332 domain-containing protein [Bacteroidales bacterium]